MDDREDRIRARAYELWEAAGRPEGQQSKHWEQAEREIGGEGGGKAAGTRKRRSSKSAEPVNPEQTGPAQPGDTETVVSEVPVVRKKPASSRAKKPKRE